MVQMSRVFDVSIVTDIHISLFSLFSMVSLMVKAAIALVPAVIIVAVLWAAVMGMLAAP